MGVGQSIRSILGSLVLAGTAMAQPTDAEIETRLHEGVQQFESGDLATARATFEFVLAERPDHVIGIYELSLTLLRQGEFDRALAMMDDAFARNLPVTVEFYALSASILENLGRVDDAVRRFEQGVAAYPDNANLHLNFGITQIRRNDAAGAKASFERAITLQPEHPSAHFYVGQIYAAEELTAAAVIALTKGIGVDTVAQRRVAAANIIKELMDNGIALSDGGAPIVVMPVDYQVPPTTLDKLTAAVGLHYTTGYAAQKKSDGDLSYEPYAIALSLLVYEFASAGIDPASHFAADYYQKFFGEVVEGGQQLTYAHLALAPLNSERAAAWVQENASAWSPIRLRRAAADPPSRIAGRSPAALPARRR